MSDPEQYDHVLVSSDGVTVEKRFEEDEFPVPAIAFEIESSRSETVTIVLSDEVPESVAVEDLGFHPEYGSEYWEITENRISFEREIEPNSEYTTVYGIRATGTDDVDQFLTEPTIRSVDPPLEGGNDSVVDETGTDVVRDVLAGNSDTVPGLEDEAEEKDTDEEEVGTLDLADPNTTGADRPTADSEATTGQAPGGGTDTLVGALAAELRNGDVEKDDVRLLREAFEVVDDQSQSGSVDARIKRLQTDVSDLMAYADALEAFLDENGTAQQTIEEFRSELDRVTADLDEVRSTVDGIESSLEAMESEMDAVLGDIDAIAEEVDAVKGDVTEVDETVDEVEETVDEVEGTVDEVEETVDEVEGTVDEVEETVVEVEGTVDQMEGTVDQMEGTVEDVETSVEAVEAELDDLASQVGDIDVEGVTADIDRIDEDISDLKEWRDQLTSAMGGD